MLADRVKALTKAAERCAVLVNDRGSGVWIAPGVVLTCAHVVPAAGLPVIIRWQGTLLAGRVRVRLPEAPGADGLWRLPDLAVVDVAEVWEHPCARLSEDEPLHDTQLLAFGYDTTYGSVLEATTASGRFAGAHYMSGNVSWRFAGDEFRAGMSGGPVIDVASGGVCGLTKTTRQAATVLGGLVTPVLGLRDLDLPMWQALWRKHDRYHMKAHTWPRTDQADATQAGRYLATNEEIDLLGMLADEPVSDHLYDLYRRFAPDGPTPEPALRDLRDVARALADCWSRDGLHPVVRFALHYRKLRLREWASRVAGRLGQYELLPPLNEPVTEAVEAGERSAVVVQIRPSALDAERYLLTIWVRTGSETAKIYCDDSAVHTIDGVRSELRARLADALRRAPGRPLLEFVTSVELFNEPFEELAPVRRFAPLGRTYSVVLRDLDQLDQPEVWPAWRTRWRLLNESVIALQPEWWYCDDRRSPDELDGYFRGRPDITVLGLSRRPDAGAGRDALEVALYAGVPAAVWRRDTCAEHDDGAPVAGCCGHRFRDAFQQERGANPTATLPSLARTIRIRCARQHDHGCRNLVVLWDDPDHLPEPNIPLYAPPMQKQGELPHG
ncbi:trypsin-like peptidase domain-containing protein [Actinomycetes bacterium KLBMP 9797]